MYTYRGPYTMFNITADDDGEAKDIMDRVFSAHNLYASESDSGDGLALGVAAVPLDEYYDFITDMYESIGERVIDCPEFAILESTATYVVVKIASGSEEADQIRSAMTNSGLYLEDVRSVNGWDIVKFSGTGINACLLYSHYPFVKDFVWDDYESDPITPPPTPVHEELTLFVYGYLEGAHAADWSQNGQIEATWARMHNDYPDATIRAEEGRRYDDGELGEYIWCIESTDEGTVDAFINEYRRCYSDYDRISERKPELPERGQPAPELEERLWYFDSDYIPDVQTTLSQIRFNAIDRGFTNVVEYPEDPESWLSAEYAWIVPIRMAPEAHDWLAAGHPGAYFAVDDIRPWKG